MSILLTTLNARYTHASLGLRYLLANMGELQEQTRLQEFVIGAKTTEIVERILAHAPKIVGFGIYIWNVEETTKVVAMLKRVAPHVMVVLGGPEVSYESNEQEIVKLADYLITGWGDVTFPKLCGEILNGPKPLMKIHAGVQPPMAEIKLPYSLYTDDDIKNRTIYVEASRGCPFKCEFCLSALDKTAWPFALESFLAEMESLHARGARLFKFVDRTFNLNIKTSLKIMQFFLDKLEANPDDPVYAHFELVPDHLPDALKEGISKFPPGALQFEIGIQSFNPAVQTLVSRKQDNQKAADNIRWLTDQSHAHMHVDLIAGLPGETVESFAEGFNKLWALNPHEIQFGILKRLRGTPIIRHTQEFGLVFEPYAPYTILANRDIDFPTMQRLVRFARYWDLVANSGRFGNTLPVLLGDRRSSVSWPSPTGCTRIPTPPTASRWTGWWRWCRDICKRKAWTRRCRCAAGQRLCRSEGQVGRDAGAKTPGAPAGRLSQTGRSGDWRSQRPDSALSARNHPAFARARQRTPAMNIGSGPGANSLKLMVMPTAQEPTLTLNPAAAKGPVAAGGTWQVHALAQGKAMAPSRRCSNPSRPITSSGTCRHRQHGPHRRPAVLERLGQGPAGRPATGAGAGRILQPPGNHRQTRTPALARPAPDVGDEAGLRNAAVLRAHGRP
jgi:radical SAM superfamily enzyme YgiQ (UPF0313 family)